MFHKDATIKIQEGALVVSDVHYAQHREEFFYFLEDIYSAKIETSQLLLMGDIFDLLFAPIDALIQRDAKLIALLNRLAQKIEIIYFEGNHDFCLAPLFSNIKVIPLSHQPLQVSANGATLYLAHGDYGLDSAYKIYTFIVRNPSVLKFLNLLNNITDNFLVKRLDNYLTQKDNCHKFEGFEEYITQKIERLELKQRATFIEGHHHQGKSVTIGEINYINLDAFACNQSYYSVKFSEELLTLSVNSFKHSKK